MPPRSRSSWIIRAGLLLPVLFLLGLLAGAVVRHQRTFEVGAALARGEAPPIPALTLPAFDGRPVSLASLRGHAVVINFWASWCVPCRAEAPLLEAVSSEFRAKGLVVLGVDTQDLEAPARDFLRHHRISYLNVRDPDGTVAHLFGTTGVPETFFVDSGGRIRGKFPGEQISGSAWHAAVEALLSGQKRVP